MKVQTTIDLETLYGTLEDVPVSYTLNRYPAEPTSWGASRGEEFEIEITSLDEKPAASVAGFLGIDLRHIEEELSHRHDA